MIRSFLLFFILLFTNNILHAQKLEVPPNYEVQFLPDDYTKGKRLRTTAKIMRWTSGALMLVGLTTMMGSGASTGSGDPDKVANRGATLATVGVFTWIASIPINRKGKKLMKEAY